MKNSKRILAAFPATVMLFVFSGCGGGGGGGVKDGLDRYLAVENQVDGTLVANVVGIRGSASTRNLEAVCYEFEPLTREQIEGQADEIYSNGACFYNYSTCAYVTDNAILTTNAFSRIFFTPQSNGGYSEVGIFYTGNVASSQFYAEAGIKLSQCTMGTPEIPLLNGKYQGYAYYIDDSTVDLSKQSLIKSSKIVLKCVNSDCTPENDNVIEGLGGSLNLSPISSGDGDYILTQFVTPDNTKGYQFWGTTSNDGKIISALAYPVGTSADYSDCYSGECFFLAFEKIAN